MLPPNQHVMGLLCCYTTVQGGQDKKKTFPHHGNIWQIYSLMFIEKPATSCRRHNRAGECCDFRVSCVKLWKKTSAFPRRAFVSVLLFRLHSGLYVLNIIQKIVMVWWAVWGVCGSVHSFKFESLAARTSQFLFRHTVTNGYMSLNMNDFIETLTSSHRKHVFGVHTPL